MRYEMFTEMQSSTIEMIQCT